MTKFEQFMQEIAKQAYPEPRTSGHDQIIEMMAPKIAALIPENGHILDVGCGQGPALEWFKNKGYDIRGITLSQEDVDVCQAAGLNASIGDQNDLGLYYDAYFDCVWARHVIEHSIAPMWTLREFKRVLICGGILYLEVPAPGTDCHHEANLNHYSVLGHDMWLSLLQRSGFDVIEAQEMNLNTAAGKDIYWTFICRKK